MKGRFQGLMVLNPFAANVATPIGGVLMPAESTLYLLQPTSVLHGMCTPYTYQQHCIISVTCLLNTITK